MVVGLEQALDGLAARAGDGRAAQQRSTKLRADRVRIRKVVEVAAIEVATTPSGMCNLDCTHANLGDYVVAALTSGGVTTSSRPSSSSTPLCDPKALFSQSS